MAQDAKATAKVEEKSTAKITVVKAFRDKFNLSVRYEVGTEVEFEEERAADAVARELAQYVEPIA